LDLLLVPFGTVAHTGMLRTTDAPPPQPQWTKCAFYHFLISRCLLLAMKLLWQLLFCLNCIGLWKGSN